MKGQMHTDLGQVIIDEEVIATYAGINAIECFGIVGCHSNDTKTLNRVNSGISCNNLFIYNNLT